jgi:hypothetical protein
VFAAAAIQGASMTGSDLQALLLAAIVRENGGERRRWRIVLGEVRVYSLTTHPHCNWTVTPSGTFAEVDVVETLIDRIRAEHPIVEPR